MMFSRKLVRKDVFERTPQVGLWAWKSPQMKKEGGERGNERKDVVRARVLLRRNINRTL